MNNARTEIVKILVEYNSEQMKLDINSLKLHTYKQTYT